MSEAVIRTDGLTKRYGKLTAVDQASLAIEPGRVFALMGRNGAGKTSLVRCLLGLSEISGGSATVLGLDSGRDHVRIRQQVGYVPETHHLYPWMTVGELLRFTSAFYPSWDVALCRDLVAGLGLDPGRKIEALSRGMVAKVALTAALAHKPPVLVLDEPTSGLDAVVRKEFLESIVNVAADEGRIVLISSHLLNDVERVADHVALMVDGRILMVEELDAVKARMREIKIAFSGQPPGSFEAAGVVSLQKEGREWLLVVEDFGPDTMGKLQAELPAATFDVRVMNLEQIFVALVGRQAATCGRPADESGSSQTGTEGTAASDAAAA